MPRFWITVLLLFLLNSAYSQSSGYIGKKHEVSLDIGSLAFQNIQVNYKFSLLKHFAVMLEYNHHRGCWGCRINTYRGNSYGLGFLTNSQNPKMEMPIGYYLGLMYTFNNGNIYSLMPDDYITNDINKGQALKVIIGKDTALSPSFTLDVNLELGYKWGYLQVEEYSYFSLGEPMPRGNPELLPRDNIFSNSARYKTDELMIDSMPTAIHRYARFIVWPRIRIGFMF